MTAALYGVGVAHATVAVFAAIGLVLLAACYQPRTSPPKAAAHARLSRNSASLVIIAVIAWSLYTVGYGMILSFGPSMLTERGWSIADAGSTTSIVIWLGALSTLIGGALADKTKRYSLISVASYLMFAILLTVAPRCDSLILAFVALGVVSGLPVASVVSLPVRLLPPKVRPIGLGVFYTVFYVLLRNDDRAGAGGKVRDLVRHGRCRLRLRCCSGSRRSGAARRVGLLPWVFTPTARGG
jgi:predicted MFS family arabinose efflux permease